MELLILHQNAAGYIFRLRWLAGYPNPLLKRVGALEREGFLTDTELLEIHTAIQGKEDEHGKRSPRVRNLPE